MTSHASLQEQAVRLLAPPRQHAPQGAGIAVPPTRLIGRVHDVVDVGALLSQPHVRLLTLTGPGGVGKSRLGLEVATEQDDAFPGGIHMVSLATIHDPALVLPTVVRALGIRGDGSQSLMASLVEQIGGRRLLLILDNFEQLADASSPLRSYWPPVPD